MKMPETIRNIMMRSALDSDDLAVVLEIRLSKGDDTLKNRQTITIIENISKQHTIPAGQRAFKKAIAGLRYCEGLTYYIEENKFHDPLDIKEKIKGEVK